MTNGRNVDTRWSALAWAAAAVGTGCALLMLLGAPSRMPVMNGVALLAGLVCTGLMALVRHKGIALVGDIALLLASALLPLTAMIGPDTDGVARWLVIGGVTLQPSLVVVPLVALGVALRPCTIRIAASSIAAIGLALQPDPGGGAMLLAGLAAPLIDPIRRRMIDVAGVVGAGIGLAVALARSIALPPVAFVEQIIPDAVAAGLIPALLALAAAMLMLAPAIARPMRAPHHAFLGVWIAALGMALLGPYPTPVIGFGGSGVLGFVLGAGLLALGTARCVAAKDR